MIDEPEAPQETQALDGEAVPDAQISVYDELAGIEIEGLVGWEALPPPVPGLNRIEKNSGHWGRLAEVLWRVATQDWQAWQYHQSRISPDHPDYDQPCPPQAVRLSNVRRDRQSYLRSHYDLSVTTRERRREPILDPVTGQQLVNKAGELRWRDVCEMWVWADPEVAGQIAQATAQLPPLADEAIPAAEDPTAGLLDEDGWYDPDNYTEDA